MERVLACRAPLVRRLHICGDDRVADGTLTLSLQRTLYVLPECKQSIHQTAIGKHDHALNSDQPALPFSLVNQDTATTYNQGRVERVRRGQNDSDCDGGRLFVHWDAGSDLCRLWRNLQRQCSLFAGILR